MEAIKQEVINGYRSIISDRYQFESLKNKYNIPDGFTRERVDEFREFFLQTIYPDTKLRFELDKAFESLDSYIEQPRKLLDLIISSGKLMLKYGFQLPKMLSAGFKTLSTFRAATSFENQLVEKARELDYNKSLNQSDIKKLISTLEQESINKFINKGEELFSLLLDKTLIDNTAEILENLIAIMKLKPKLYSPIDIRAMEIGYDMIDSGRKIFYKLNPQEQQTILNFVSKIEKEEIQNILNNKL